MQTNEVNLVAIGGGHGLGKVLNTFSDYGHKLTGIVATTDNGGSTGRLRASSDCIAWGDLRNCLTHLAGKNALGSRLLEYRFEHEELDGHSMGNLIFYALEKLHYSPIEVLELVRRLLKVESRLYPMSELPTHIRSINLDGSVVIGEVNVDAANLPVPEKLELTDNVPAPNKVLRAINAADFILLGPGSFFTSILPPILMADICQALSQTKAKIVLIDNLAKEVGPAGLMSLNDKLNWLKKHFPQLSIAAVLSPKETEKITLPGVYHLKTALEDTSNVAYRHHEKSLRKALETIFTQLA